MRPWQTQNCLQRTQLRFELSCTSFYKKKGVHKYERHYSRRRCRHTALSLDHGHQQAAAAGLRQAHDLLPAVHPHAGGHPGHPGHLHADGPAQLRAPARGRLALRREPVLRRAAFAGRPGAGLHHRRGLHRRRAVRPRARRQHLLRQRPVAPPDARRPERRVGEGHGLRLPRGRPRALRRR